MSQVSGAVVPDRLNGFLSALRNTDNEHRRDGERRLADYVEAERRDLDSDGFAKLDQLIQERINALARGCVLLPPWWNSCTSTNRSMHSRTALHVPGMDADKPCRLTREHDQLADSRSLAYV